MSPVSVCIFVSILCFGYVSAVERDYSTQPGETVLYLNNENNASLSDLHNITNSEVSFARPLEVEEEREDNRPTDDEREEEELNWGQFKCILGKDVDITVVYSASNGTFITGDESKNGSYCSVLPCHYPINGTILKGFCVSVFTVNTTELAMSGVKKEEITIGLTPGTYVQFNLFVKTNNYDYDDEFGDKGPPDEHGEDDRDRDGFRPTDYVREEQEINWEQFKCNFAKDVDITVVDSVFNGTFTKGDEFKNGSYCLILPCYYRINGTMSEGFCVNVFTVNTTEFAMSGVKNEEIIVGLTPGTYVQFNLFINTNNDDYDDEFGGMGPLHEDEEVDGERKGLRLIKVLGENESLESEEQYCIQGIDDIIKVVYNASYGTFAEEQAMNGANYIQFSGFYRVNTDLTIRTCVYVYSISSIELTKKFLQLPEMQEIPFHRRFIIGLTTRVFIKSKLYVKQHKDDFPLFVNFTYHDFMRAWGIRNFMDTFYQMLIVTSTISIVGNLLICAVIIKYRTMRNSPNIYTFNLALADIVTFSVVLIQKIVPKEGKISRLQWVSISFRDMIILGLDSTSRDVNIWTTVGITVDRYLAICHPFLARTVSTQSKAVKINIAIWIVLIFRTLVYWLYLRLDTIGYNSPEMDIFKVINNSTTFTILFMWLPMFIIIILYVFIVRSIWKSSKLKGSSNTRGQSMRGKSLKLSVAIVVQLFISYVPLSSFMYVWSILQGFGVDNFYIKLMIKGVKAVILLSATMDIVLYSLVSKRFREAFKDMLCPSWIRRKWL